MHIQRTIRERIQWLSETSRPFFGQFSLWVLLLASMYLVGSLDGGYPHRDKGVTVSVIGYILSASVFSNEQLFELCRYAFFAASLCWFFRKFLPVSSWLTVILYTVTISFYWENLPWFRHKYVLPNWLLLVYALWMHFYQDDIRAARKEKRFWNTALFPNWVLFLSVFSIAVLYTYSGISKLRWVGWEWGNGLSLQIWMTLFGDSDSWITRLILSDRLYAMVLQSGTLLLECLAFLAIFSRRCRIVIAVGLISLHLSVAMTFHIDFATNVVLLSVYFLPIDRLIPRLVARIRTAVAESLPPELTVAGTVSVDRDERFG